MKLDNVDRLVLAQNLPLKGGGPYLHKQQNPSVPAAAQSSLQA